MRTRFRNRALQLIANPELYTDAVPNRPGREKVNLCRALGQLELTLHGCDPRINMLKADDKART